MQRPHRFVTSLCGGLAGGFKHESLMKVRSFPCQHDLGLLEAGLDLAALKVLVVSGAPMTSDALGEVLSFQHIYVHFLVLFFASPGTVKGGRNSTEHRITRCRSPELRSVKAHVDTFIQGCYNLYYGDFAPQLV